MIELRQVTKTFAGSGREVPAVAGLDLQVDDGEFVAVIGPSGCGKSTLLRLIGGLVPPDGGTISVNATDPDTARREKRFGFVPQTPALLPWRSVRDNVRALVDVNTRVGAVHAAEEGVDHLLARVGLADRADARPNELSGGMRQRVSLARAFALQPQILLLDEPFSALDEITREQMQFLLLDLWLEHRSTVVFVTHGVDEAVLLADRVVVLGGPPGRVAAEERIEIARPRRPAVIDGDTFHHHAASIRAALRDVS